MAKLLGIHTATRTDIINAIWQYIKVCVCVCVCLCALLKGALFVMFPTNPSPQNNRLQDPQEREFINNDKYFQQVALTNSVYQCYFLSEAQYAHSFCYM